MIRKNLLTQWYTLALITIIFWGCGTKKKQDVYYQVTVPKLNIRSEASTTSTLTGQITKGEKVKLISKTEKVGTFNDITSTWYEIQTTQNLKGYVFGGFLTDLPSSLVQPKNPKQPNKNIPELISSKVDTIKQANLYKKLCGDMEGLSKEGKIEKQWTEENVHDSKIKNIHSKISYMGDALFETVEIKEYDKFMVKSATITAPIIVLSSGIHVGMDISKLEKLAGQKLTSTRIEIIEPVWGYYSPFILTFSKAGILEKIQYSTWID